MYRERHGIAWQVYMLFVLFPSFVHRNTTFTVFFLHSVRNHDSNDRRPIHLSISSTHTHAHPHPHAYRLSIGCDELALSICISLRPYTYNKAYESTWLHSWLFPMKHRVWAFCLCCSKLTAANARSRSLPFILCGILMLTNTWRVYAVRFLYL